MSPDFGQADSALDSALDTATASERGAYEVAQSLSADEYSRVLEWARQSAARQDRVLAPLFQIERLGDDRAAIAQAARARVSQGPLVDALCSLPATGAGSWLSMRDAGVERARVDLLLWEAGGSGLSLPSLGQWLWVNAPARQALFVEPSRGTLRQRCLAARTLAVAADGVTATPTSVSVFAEARRIAFDLAEHPDPDVWKPAARALGRLAGHEQPIRLALDTWFAGDVVKHRRRAVTALASMPANSWLSDRLDEIIADPDPWLGASLGPAGSIIAREQPGLWRQAVARLFESGRAEAIWSITQGLLPLCRRDPPDAHTEATLRAARRRSFEADGSVTQNHLWRLVRRETDFLDALPPDPAYLDVQLDRAVSDAVRAGARVVADRARSIGERVGPVFDACLEKVCQPDVADRARAILELESSQRALSLALHEPILAAAGAEAVEPRAFPFEIVSRTLNQKTLGFAAGRAVFRAIGAAIDSAPGGVERPSERMLAAGSGIAMIVSSEWARSATPREVGRFRRLINDVVWRTADAFGVRPMNGAKLGALAAWSALAVGNADLIELVAEQPSIDRDSVDDSISAIKQTPSEAATGVPTAQWSAQLFRSFSRLGIAESALAYAVESLAAALMSAERELPSESFNHDVVFEGLGHATALVAALRRNPSAALVAARDSSLVVERADELLQHTNAWIEGASDVKDPIGSWREPLGPVLGPASTPVMRTLLDRARSSVKVPATDKIGPYEKLQMLGRGGGGEVWLVRRPGGRRRWVLKYPVGLSESSPERFAVLSRLLEREAQLLESLHAAKVATYHDHGWDGPIPFLVLEYLIGADLGRYVGVRPTTIAELRPIMRDVLIGLHGLHDRGIVHLDLKPSNVFLRLQLPSKAQETFADHHREPENAPIAEAVLIDLGIAALLKEQAERRGVSGTLGYLSPEQAKGLTGVPASDIYALGATIYSALTGARFFEQHANPTAMIVAHATEPPFDDERIRAKVAGLPKALVSLLSEATDLDPTARPSLSELAERFDLATR